MRICIDILDPQVRELDRLAKQDSSSRAAVIRQVIDVFLRSRAEAPSEDAFGLWADQKLDDLEYQEGLRAEWENR